MRLLLCILVSIGLARVSLAQDPAEPYPDEFRDLLISMCATNGASETLCACSIDRLAGQFEFRELLDLIVASEGDNLSPELEQAFIDHAVACVASEMQREDANPNESSDNLGAKYPKLYRDIIFNSCNNQDEFTIEVCYCTLLEIERTIPFSDVLGEVVSREGQEEFSEALANRIVVAALTCKFTN